MRIIYMTNEWLGKEGAGVTHFKAVAHELAALGHKVYILAPGYLHDKPKGWDVPMIFLPLPGRNIFSFILFELLLGFFMAISVAVLRVDVVLNRGSVSSTILHAICKILGRRYVVEVNGVADIEIETTSLPLLIKRLFRLIWKFNYRYADSFICVSKGIHEELSSKWAYFAKKSVVINNGVDVSVIKPMDDLACRKELGFPEDRFVVGFLGTLAPWHGIDNLLDATKILHDRGHKNFTTLIVGGGNRLESLKEKVAVAGIQDIVHFAGHVDHDQVSQYVATFDIACQVHNDPVIGHLGDPLKFWEYLASARAILLSDMSSSKMFLKPGLIGWLFRGGDVEDMADKLEYILAHRSECFEIGRNNRNFVEDGHRWKDVAKRVESVLAENNK